MRGREDTTAAAHLDDATITERDIVYTGQVEPTDLVDQNDETTIPEPLVLANGAGADLALKKGDKVLHDRLIARYDRGMTGLKEKWTVKMTAMFGTVKDSSQVVSDNQMIRNSNDFPSSVG